MEHPLNRLIGPGVIRRYCIVSSHAHVHELIEEDNEPKNMIYPATLEINHPAYGGILSEVTVNGDRFVPEGVLFAAMQEVDRLRQIVGWINMNMPRTLELCPYKLSIEELQRL